MILGGILLGLFLASGGDRPAAWAVPLRLSGVGNLAKVNDSLFRSEQPTRDGFRRMVDSLGIRTVIDLRSFHDDKDLVAGTGLGLHQVGMSTWSIHDSEVVRALRVVRWAHAGPYLVHCQHGADRTGVVNAVYRIVFQGWTREDAAREMEEGGYGFHPVWRNIPRYLREFDSAAVRRAVEASP